jgi:ABC-type multidrug transport system fused ATPase/permease subunit
MSNTKNDDNSYKEKLTEKYNQLKANIGDLQDVEKYMFENLNKIDKTDATAHEEAIIKARIKELSDIRKSLFEQLKDLYMDNTNQTESSREDLIDKLTMKDVLTQELGNVNERINILETEKTNKQRLVEMGDYEFDRYSSHIDIFKIFTYSILFILIILLLVNYLGFPMAIAKLFIILIIAVLIYFSAQKMFYNFVRSPINFNRFNQGSTGKFQVDNDLTNQNSILDNNLSFFDRLFNRDICGYNLKDTADKYINKVNDADIKVKVTSKEKFTNPIVSISNKIDSIFNVKPIPYSEYDSMYHKI